MCLDRVGTTLGRFGIILTCLGRHLESLWGRLALVWLCISMQQYRTLGLEAHVGSHPTALGSSRVLVVLFGGGLIVWAV